ncbi:hypothetical protein ABID21_003547 [Pseudorhizobium tarimense]|uniref:Probable branched-chain-amino-acid aminotransferase n=1 Tax=Pseudorhizobium tarimense TaxID=1079109 RepID=A0ABV2HB43_9HYPH
MARAPLIAVIREVLRRNRVTNGIFYLQVTRETARRDHFFPSSDTPPTLTITAKSVDPAPMQRKCRDGIHLIIVPENRWDRVDIKTVGLLPNVLAKQQARDSGAQDAIFIDRHGNVTESASRTSGSSAGMGHSSLALPSTASCKASPVPRSWTWRPSSAWRWRSVSFRKTRCSVRAKFF